MDLPYPSHHDVNLTSNINRIDKLRRSIKLSHNQIPIPILQQLRKNQKEKILKFLSFDYGFNLSAFIQKNSIRINAEIGTPGSLWNILHFACKFNAVQCLQYLLKEQYNNFPEEYQQLINSKTIEGYTSLVICIINQANQALNLLLSYGGVDIHLIDSKKMTAYEVAINYNNQNAIKMLMNYQHQSKKSKKLNKIKLSQPIMFTKREVSCCSDILGYLLSCLSLGNYPIQSRSLNSQIGQSDIKKLSSEDKNKFKGNFLLSKDNYVDAVEIGKQEDQQSYQIIWKKIQEIITNKKYPLFDSYNPFDICQNNLVLKNNLILMQCISQHPWLVRKIIQSNKNRLNFYCVNLYINFELTKISVDNHIPFLKDRSQPMFISNQNEMWPMILQKGLAKIHDNYFNLEQISPKLLIEQMTGFPTFQIDLQNFSSTNSSNKIINLLQELTKKGFLFLLQGKQGSSLSNQGRVDCFSVLNFFDKGDKKLILVNCPFVDQRWRQKQKYQILALKLIKSHINKHNQMCVWIDEEKITQYFSKIIVSATLPNYQRTSVKIKVITNQFFFTFKIDKQREQNFIMQLVDLDNKKVLQMHSAKGYINEGMANFELKNGVQNENYSYGIKSISNVPGQYLCHVKFAQSDSFSSSPPSSIKETQKIKMKQTNIMLICWSIDAIQPIHLDQMMGPIQYLQCFKLNMIKYWQSVQPYLIQIISDHAMIIVKQNQEIQTIYMQSPLKITDVVEGKMLRQNTVQLIKQQMGGYSGEIYFYCVLRNVNEGQLNQYKKQKKINFLSSAK